MATISVVIVNFNGETLLEDCLDGLEAQTRAADEVILVDNCSTDASVELVRRNYPWVDLIELDKNRGFAVGNNVGIRASVGEIVVLLNNDTIPSVGFIESITAPLENDPEISAVAGTLLFASEPDIVASAGIDVYENGLALDAATGTSWRDLSYRFEVFGPSAGAAAYRRSALDEVEHFPEPFFLYLEDVDLAWRLRLRQHRSVGLTSAWVLHVYSASSVEGSPLKDYFLSRNRPWTLIRCWPATFWKRFWWPLLKYEAGAVMYGLLTRRWALIRGRLDGWRGYWRLRRVRRRIHSASSSSETELLYWMRSNPSVRNIFQGRSVIKAMVGTSSSAHPSIGSDRNHDNPG